MILGHAALYPFNIFRLSTLNFVDIGFYIKYNEEKERSGKMEKLYHYTSVNGFASIVNNKALRITRSDFMNDPHDCHVFFDIVEKYISRKLKTLKCEEHIQHEHNRRYVEKVLEAYPPTAYMRYLYRTVPMYVLSLTSEADSLPMWNYYGGDGIRLAFDSDRLIQTLCRNLCQLPFEFLVKTKVEYIDSDAKLESLTLNSFSDFYVYESDYETGETTLRTHSLQHNEGDNLQFFVDSFIISYIKTIDFVAEREARWGHPRGETMLELDADGFFSKIFYNNKNQQSEKTKFKTDIDLYMLILASRYKIKTFENEHETRIVYFKFHSDRKPDEKIITANYKFGSFLKPVIETPLEMGSVSDILLSPSSKQLPVDMETYKSVVRSFCGMPETFPVEISKHDLRW